MKIFIELAEKGVLPDVLIRMGIRRLNRKRLKDENRRDVESHWFAIQRFIEDMKETPIAISTDKANIQHYELPQQHEATFSSEQRSLSDSRQNVGLARKWFLRFPVRKIVFKSTE